MCDDPETECMPFKREASHWLLSNGTDFQQQTVPEMCNHIYRDLKQEIFFIIHLLRR